MRTQQWPRSPGFCPSSANLMCGLRQVTAPLWACISPTAKCDFGGAGASGGRGVTLKWVFFVLLPPSDSLGQVCTGRVVFASPGRADAVKGKCAWGRLSWTSRSFNGGSEAPCVAFNFFFFWWHHVTKSAPCFNHCSSSELN